jgi:hypothetical protein
MIMRHKGGRRLSPSALEHSDRHYLCRIRIRQRPQEARFRDDSNYWFNYALDLCFDSATKYLRGLREIENYAVKHMEQKSSTMA